MKSFQRSNITKTRKIFFAKPLKNWNRKGECFWKELFSYYLMQSKKNWSLFNTWSICWYWFPFFSKKKKKFDNWSVLNAKESSQFCNSLSLLRFKCLDPNGFLFSFFWLRNWWMVDFVIKNKGSFWCFGLIIHVICSKKISKTSSFQTQNTGKPFPKASKKVNRKSCWRIWL